MGDEDTEDEGREKSPSLPTPAMAKDEVVMSKTILADERERAWRSRRELPHTRYGVTLEACVGGHKVFLRTGEYHNHDLGEIFVDMYKEGAAYRSMMNSFAQAVSVGLQYGVPLEKFVKMFSFTRFDPCGITDHPNVRNATSILDFIFRVLGMRYLDMHDFVHVPPQPVTLSKEETPLTTVLPANPIKTTPRDTIQSGTPHTGISQPTAMGSANPNEHLAEMMGDAPVCDSCGHLTVRNGSCYRCLNCGNSMGCS